MGLPPEFQPPEDGARPPRGRYRFRAGRPVDPAEEPHPEAAEALPAPAASAVPDSPHQLLAMQCGEALPSGRPEKPERSASAKVEAVLDLIDRLGTTCFEDQQIALALLRQLEAFHDGIVEELRDDASARHSQIIAWAIDADRLMRARTLLESVDLE